MKSQVLHTVGCYISGIGCRGNLKLLTLGSGRVKGQMQSPKQLSLIRKTFKSLILKFWRKRTLFAEFSSFLAKIFRNTSGQEQLTHRPAVRDGLSATFVNLWHPNQPVQRSFDLECRARNSLPHVDRAQIIAVQGNLTQLLSTYDTLTNLSSGLLALSREHATLYRTSTSRNSSPSRGSSQNFCQLMTP